MVERIPIQERAAIHNMTYLSRQDTTQHTISRPPINAQNVPE